MPISSAPASTAILKAHCSEPSGTENWSAGLSTSRMCTHMIRRRARRASGQRLGATASVLPESPTT